MTRRPWIAALLGAACLTYPAPAQEPPAPAAIADIIPIGIDRHTRMTVPVQVDGSGPFAFVVDTGAERTVISRELAATLRLNGAGTATLLSMSGSGPVQTVLIPTLGVSTGMIRDIRAPTLDRANIGAMGILGIDSLQKQRILLDFTAGTMAITPSKKREPRWDGEAIVVTAQSRFGQLVLVDASVDGRKIHVIIDTGAQVSVGNAALQRLVGRKKLAPFVPIDLISVTGGVMPALYSAISDVRIGGLHIANLPVAFAEVQPFRKFGVANKPALLLGMDGLKLFDRVSIDFANRRVRFLMPEGGSDGGLLLTALERIGGG